MDSKTKPQRKAKVGIIFLHGIGNQKPGEMLTTFGDPFIRFLKDWFEDDLGPITPHRTDPY